MLTFFNIVSGLASIMFFISIGGLIYSLIRKKRKLPWILGIIGGFALASMIVLFDDEILDRLDFPDEKIEDVSKDPEGTVRIKEGKYIVGEEVKEGWYDLTFQKDSGSFEIVNLYQGGEFRDSTAFGQNPKFRLYLKDGDGIDINLGIAIFTPATIEKKSYERAEITAGVWIVGETLAPGRYKIQDVKGPGNVRVRGTDGKLKITEVIGDGIILDLVDNDVLSITGTSITLVPEN